MPKLVIDGHGSYELAAGLRLVSAIEACGADISHRCGGYAKCTTCRVSFRSGEPRRMTRVEAEKLRSTDLEGKVRLSCQCVVDGDMELEVLMPVSQEAWDDPGPRPEVLITPDPEWIDLPDDT